MSTTPGLAPPPGQTSNFDHPWSISHAIYGFSGFVIGVTTLSTALRAYVRFLVSRNPGWDDYLVIPAWMLFIPFSAMSMATVKYGAGKHQWDVPLVEIGTFARIALAQESLYPIVICMVKVSICLQFLRIFVAGHRVVESKLIWGFILLQTMWFFTCFWFNLFQCTPISKRWSPETPGTCSSGFRAHVIVVSVFNAVSDALILTYPLVCLSRIHLPCRKKIGVGAVFLLGSMALLSSILRVTLAVQNFHHSQDETWVVTRLGLCSSAEITAGIVACNSISIPALFVKAAKKITSMDGGESAQSSAIDSRRCSEALEDSGADIEATETKSGIS